MAWNASRQARRALADALPLMTAAESVDLLIVDPQSDEERHEGERYAATDVISGAPHPARQMVVGICSVQMTTPEQ